MSKIVQFGETVEGYNIPVLNEREIRAAAGILFQFAFVSILIIIFNGNFIPLKFFIISFLVDFIIRVFINPRFAPTLILGRLIVWNQTPEYVGAPQKKFAWSIGLVLVIIMLVLMVILNTYSIITGLICLICLLFLFFESVFGICLGCIFYRLVYKEKVQYCPGEVCEMKDRVAIQKTTKSQLLIFLLFILFIIGSVYGLKDSLSSKPVDLWVKIGVQKEATQ